MALADDLRAAKALIDTPEKWAKGDYEVRGCLCALGAARMAYFGRVHRTGKRLGRWEGDDNPITDALRSELGEEWCRSVDDFNDDPDTTHADIMALFDRAIAKAEGGAP